MESVCILVCQDYIITFISHRHVQAFRLFSQQRSAMD